METIVIIAFALVAIGFLGIEGTAPDPNCSKCHGKGWYTDLVDCFHPYESPEYYEQEVFCGCWNNEHYKMQKRRDKEKKLFKPLIHTVYPPNYKPKQN